MNEFIVCYETALLAKEKGFDWDTIWYYNTDKESIQSVYYDDTPNNKTVPVNEWMANDEYFQCTAPTQAYLQKWLREVHKLHINIHPHYDNFGEHTGWDLTSITPLLEGRNTIIQAMFEMYEEALEMGLQEALKLI
jgi:hypothetical protein